MLNVKEIVEWVAVILILFGSVISVISAFGMIRLPDVYTRSHAATKSATLSVLVCLLGAFVYFWFHDGYISIRIILGIIFVFITAPVSGHLVTRAAYRSRVPLAEGSGEDELKPVLFGESNQIDHLAFAGGRAEMQPLVDKDVHTSTLIKDERIDGEEIPIDVPGDKIENKSFDSLNADENGK